MRNDPRIRRSQRNALLAGALVLLMFGASRVFSQAPSTPTTPSADPLHEVLLLKKTALEAEIKAASGRLAQANRRIKNAEARKRSSLQSDDFIQSANVDFLEFQAVIARKRVELKEITNRLEGHAGNVPSGGSLLDVTDNLLRRIKDLETRVDQLEAIAREKRLRSSAPEKKTDFRGLAVSVPFLL